jgi:uncharacterized membrane protein YedE/YeeE
MDRQITCGLTIAPSAQTKGVSFWLVFVALGLMLGSHFSARMRGTAKHLPKQPRQTLLALVGAVLVGVGAWLATGCVIGNILSGWALMSVGLLIFGAATILSNWAVTHLISHGRLVPGRLRPLPSRAYRGRKEKSSPGVVL